MKEEYKENDIVVLKWGSTDVLFLITGKDPLGKEDWFGVNMFGREVYSHNSYAIPKDSVSRKATEEEICHARSVDPIYNPHYKEKSDESNQKS